MIIEVEPPEIQTPSTPGSSLGTKFLVPKFSSYLPLMMLCYVFCTFLWIKLSKNEWNYRFLPNVTQTAKWGKNVRFSGFSQILPKYLCKTHKMSSLEDDKRKILRQKFWSQGTSLGSMGPLSQEALGQRFYQLQILIIWGPYEPPALKASQGTP